MMIRRCTRFHLRANYPRLLIRSLLSCQHLLQSQWSLKVSGIFPTTDHAVQGNIQQPLVITCASLDVSTCCNPEYCRHCYAGQYVQPLFITMNFSRYDPDKVVWKADLTQEDALGFNLNSCDQSECDIMDEVQRELMENPDGSIVRRENPCHYGVVLGGYMNGNLYCYCIL